MTTSHRIVFTPSGLHGEVPDGTTVLSAAQQLGVDLDSVCGGRGICGRCQVEPSVGEFPKWRLHVAQDALGEWSDNEQRFDSKRGLKSGRRLGCGATICGDIVIDVPADSQVHRQIVRKELRIAGLAVDPIVELRYVEVPAPELGDEQTDQRALREALWSEWGIEGAQIGHRVLTQLSGALRAGKRAVTVAIRGGAEVVAVWPGYVDRIVGAAVDIGSTTIAAYLLDLRTGELLATAGAMNPQIRFGEDLMSRVSYVMMHDDGRTALTDALRSGVADVLTDLLAAAAVPADRLLDMMIVGNPIMHHFFLGFDPTPLGTAPFTLATAEPVAIAAADVGLPAPNAVLTFGPCIAGHVGADTAGAILAEGPHRSERVQLLVDVGTNAEIVLGTSQRLYAASSPTGPALEGGEISCGVRATVGAIERVRIDRDSLEPKFAVIGIDGWSDEPGFAAAVSSVPVVGVCGSGIIEVVAEMFLAGIIDRQGRIDGSLAGRTDRLVADGRTFSYVLHRREPELRITQNDVRAIQLAKAALRAGVDLLREKSGSTTIDDIRLAGAFGSHIDPLYAMVLGLIPDAELERTRSAGNASGVGAVRALLSSRERREMATVASEVVKIETATESRFQELFVAAMAFPHETEATPNLARIVALPAAAVGQGEGRQRRRRRAARTEAS